jgi:hypothetical protein
MNLTPKLAENGQLLMELLRCFAGDCSEDEVQYTFRLVEVSEEVVPFQGKSLAVVRTLAAPPSLVV